MTTAAEHKIFLFLPKLGTYLMEVMVDTDVSAHDVIANDVDGARKQV